METKPIPRWRISRQDTRTRLATRVESRATGAVSLSGPDEVSVGGLLVAARETFESGTQITVRFDLPYGHLIETQGVVVHVLKGERMGIQFVELKPEDLKAMEELVWKVEKTGRLFGHG